MYAHTHTHTHTQTHTHTHTHTDTHTHTHTVTHTHTHTHTHTTNFTYNFFNFIIFFLSLLCLEKKRANLIFIYAHTYVHTHTHTHTTNFTYNFLGCQKSAPILFLLSPEVSGTSRTMSRYNIIIYNIYVNNMVNAKSVRNLLATFR